MTWYDTFHGFLFAAGPSTQSSTPVGDEIFPMKFIVEESWSSSPNFREEIKAVRDDNTRLLTRVTAEGKKSSFSFETRDNLKLKDKIEILGWFTTNEGIFTPSEESSDEAHAQRKIRLWFWNDEESKYKHGVFYRANLEYSIKRIGKDDNGNPDIIYSKMKFELVEY